MKHKLMTSTIASLMFVAGAAVAAEPTPVSVSGGTIHFEGKLVNAACAVSTKSADQTVTLGQYRTASFTAIGDTTAQVPFSIVLNDCDPKVAATAAVAFSGQADNTNTNLLAVSSADNSTTATGVGIEILDNTSSPLKPDGATFSAKQALVEGTNTLRFTARYKATAAATTPGQANADATFIMKYE
ncbi:type 1 fimbrial protein subunit FimA [Salmonella enterica]|uniref:Type 1 fimbrial protein subunit FimA n=2 Tax=Salmonella paratyphi B TaxID=57045 RepID=A0A8E6KG32_SALEB|nr:type 1 fimbrial protein subunit FimA [Salmonella enterica]ECE7001246.1 type 1 fimbrial protein subunit FimA [Salmonella enterica subsp. enterica]QVQ03134.1 type 1 fimbrial protein subunit FimA [Salmonella enterica subsp. enterica serovar Paratyphi B str. CFSAN000541]HAE2679126.1 type 1 fimbrial protein subunit FimA [Salmonella enterica subsp. enterica serovar Paratyphi B]EBT8109832.1 type 1 fimbrial protein subunit FimA [Salmonella enterica]